MDYEFCVGRKVCGVIHSYEGTAEIRVNRDAKWNWEIGTVYVRRKMGRGWFLVVADPDLSEHVRRQLRIRFSAEITRKWRHCQEGGETPREFSEYVRSVV